MDIEISDIELVARFKEPSTCNQAFEMILDKYQKRTYWLVRRIVINHDDADDLVQNTFIKVWENLANFREDAKLFTWIYRIATNESLQFLQKKRNVSLEELDSDLVAYLETGSYFDGNEAARKLQTAILQLPEKQRLVFNLKYFDNLKYEEMEKITGTSTGALKASYHHAVKKIENFITGSLNFSVENQSN